MPFELSWPYQVDTQEAKVICMNQGSSSCSNGLLTVTCGNSGISGAGMQSSYPLIVTGKQMVTCQFTAMFDSNPCPGTMQIAGVGDGEHGVFVGYNGTSFGVRLLSGGQMQYYVLRVPTATTAAGTVTLTINGVAFSYPLTASQSVSSILYQIATDPNILNGNMQTRVVNSSVVINTALAMSPQSQPSVTDTGTGCGITIAQVVAGTWPTDLWVYQPSWNGPGLNPTTPIAWNNGNTFKITIGPLGFGSISVSVLNPDSLRQTVLHTFNKISSSQGFSFVSLGLLPSLYSVNFAATQAVSLSSTGFLVDGAENSGRIRPMFSATSTNTNLFPGSPLTSVLCLQNMQLLQTTRNCKIMNMVGLDMSVSGNVSLLLSVYKDPQITAPMKGTQIDANSCTLVDATSNVSLVPNTGYLLRSWQLTATAPLVHLAIDDLWVEPGALLVFCISKLGTATLTTGILMGLTATWNQT